MNFRRHQHPRVPREFEGARRKRGPAVRRRLMTLSLVIVMVAGGIPGTAAADEHCPTEAAVVEDFAALQAAISADDGPAVVCLDLDAPLVLPTTLNLDRDGVTLMGAGEAETTLDASSVSGYGIFWTADDVTLHDLTLLGPSADAGSRYGIKVQPTDGSTSAVEGVLIERVTVRGSGRSEIDLHWTSDAQLVDVTVDGTGAVANKGVGVALTSAFNTTLTNLTSMNNGWGGIGAFLDPTTYFDDVAGTNQITIVNHTSTGDLVPLYGEELEGDGTGEIHSLNASQYTHTLRNPTHRADELDEHYTWYYQNETDALAAAVTMPAPAAASASTVRHEGTGALVVGPGMTVQTALDAVGAAGTVLVRAGDYAQVATISNAGVTLQGDGSGSTTLQGGAGTNGITVTADNVTIRGIAVVGYTDGIEAASSLDDLVLDDVDVSGANSGLKIPNVANVDGLTVTNSHFDGNAFGWYFANDTPGAPSLVTDVSVSDTTFNENLKKGIYVEKLDNAVFDEITVEDSGTDATYKFNNGIDINLKYRPFANITIKNSIVRDSGLIGAATSTAPDFLPAGIAIKARDDSPSYDAVPATLTGVSLDRVTVSGGVVGVRFGEGNKTDNDGPTNVRVQRSHLSGTSGVGLENTTTVQVNASNNWWGAPGNPGTKIKGNVQWNPACVNAECTTPPVSPPPVTPPVTGDTPPPPPPVVTPPAPSTPPAPITVPPGQTITVPRGGTTAFVGGQPAPVTTVTPPPSIPPPSQRTTQQVQQVQQTANQIVAGFQSTLPENSTTPPPVTVTTTETGATVVGLLSSPTGGSQPVPAENVILVSAGGTTVLATGADGEGNPLPLEDDGTVPAPQGGSLGTAVGGLTPGSSGQVVAFSEPQLLGTFTADDDGVFRGQIPIPHWLEPGDHTLVINGQGAQGEITLAMSITVAGSDVFSDVLANSTHAVAISRLKLSGITQGYGDGTYRPSESIGRAQMAAFLARALDLDTDTATTDLSDVVGVHAGAIAAVIDAGVATGYADGTFKPSVSVTRGQMARFLANAAGLDDVADGDLSDVSGAHAGAINAVVEAGLANGHTDGTFRKDEYVNRAQMATFIMNLVDYLAEAAED